MGGGGRRLRRRGGIFARSYAAEGRRLARFPRGLALPRLPATPEALLKGLLALIAAARCASVNSIDAASTSVTRVARCCFNGQARQSCTKSR